jgi:hypothetical protein
MHEWHDAGSTPAGPARPWRLMVEDTMNVDELLQTITDDKVRASLVEQRADLLSKVAKINQVLAFMGEPEPTVEAVEGPAGIEAGHLVSVSEEELASVLRCFRVGYGYTTRDISKASRLEYAVAFACLATLRDRGAVRSTGAGRGHRWWLS